MGSSLFGLPHPDDLNRKLLSMLLTRLLAKVNTLPKLPMPVNSALVLVTVILTFTSAAEPLVGNQARVRRDPDDPEGHNTDEQG